MSGSKSRNKGKRIEREACVFWHLVGYEDACRTAQVKGGPESPDIMNVPFHVEVKGGKTTPDIYAAMKQAQRDCDADTFPIVQVKRDREEWLFVLAEDTMDYFLKCESIVEGTVNNGTLKAG